MFLSLISAMEEDEKQDYETNVMASLFYKSTPHSLEAICWQHQCMEFTSRTFVRYTRTCAQCRDFIERGQKSKEEELDRRERMHREKLDAINRLVGIIKDQNNK